VTLMKDGKLRGCIGSLQAARSLRDDIRENALAAAFRDPRFPALTREEWPHCSLEVSLLSRPKTIRFADEADLLAQCARAKTASSSSSGERERRFCRRSGRGSPTRGRFFAELKRKAGIPPETGLGRCKVRRYRVAKWKEGLLH
jgi:AmmeMemoRadiSam system protein A